MASGRRRANSSAVMRADHRAVNELRELFWGRFTEDEVEILYHLNDYDKQLTVRHIFSSDPREIRRAIAEEKINWETVKSKRKGLPKNSLGNLRQGTIDTTSRLFACQPCDSSWWRCIPIRKQVSTCHKCKTRYDPVPRHKEWGWADFTCDCGNTFSGFCEMGVPSPCYRCKKDVYPSDIQPPKRDRQRRSKQTHSCNGCLHLGHRGTNNVYRGPFQMAGPRGTGGTTNVYSDGHYISGGVHNYPDVHQCAHPSTRRQNNLPNVLTPSVVHDSTGSTVATFLPQDDLDMNKHEVYDRISHLGSIPEESLPTLSDDEDEGDGNNSNGTNRGGD